MASRLILDITKIPRLTHSLTQDLKYITYLLNQVSENSLKDHLPMMVIRSSKCQPSQVCHRRSLYGRAVRLAKIIYWVQGRSNYSCSDRQWKAVVMKENRHNYHRPMVVIHSLLITFQTFDSPGKICLNKSSSPLIKEALPCPVILSYLWW